MAVEASTAEFVTAVSTATLAGTAIAALAFTIVQLRNQRELARIDNLEHQMDYFDGPDFLKQRQALAKQRLGQGKLRTLKDDDPPTELYRVLDFFEHIGFLVRKHHLHAYDVWHSFGGWAVPTFYDARRVIEYEQSDDPTFYDDFVWLMRKLEEIERKRTGKFEIPCDDEIYGYYEDELGGKIRASRAKKRVPKPIATIETVSPQEKIV